MPLKKTQTNHTKAISKMNSAQITARALAQTINTDCFILWNQIFKNRYNIAGLILFHLNINFANLIRK